MSYRGSALQYKIRKTTSNNKTGDNYSITIPRVIAQKFTDIYFSMSISGDSIIFESGCKIKLDYNTERKINDIIVDVNFLNVKY